MKEKGSDHEKAQVFFEFYKIKKAEAKKSKDELQRVYLESIEKLIQILQRL